MRMPTTGCPDGPWEEGYRCLLRLLWDAPTQPCRGKQLFHCDEHHIEDRSHEAAFCNVEIRCGSCAALSTLGFIFAQRYGDCMGNQHQFATYRFQLCKPHCRSRSDGLFRCGHCTEPHDQVRLPELTYEIGRRRRI